MDAAIRDAIRLTRGYTDEAGSRTTRQVRPLRLVFRGKVWTLIAWCDLRDGFRMFLLDRIATADRVGPFAPASHQSLAAFYAEECCDL